MEKLWNLNNNWTFKLSQLFLKEITTYLSNSSVVTISSLLPILSEIKNLLRKSQTDSEIIEKIKE